MAVNFSPETEDDSPAPREKGGNQPILLLVLLLLVMVFGYLYFFTGMIRPLAEAPKPPPVQTAQVKKPLPPRPEQGREKQEPAAAPSGMPSMPATAAKPAPQSAPAGAIPAAVPVQPAPAKAVKAEEKPVQKVEVQAPAAQAAAVRKQGKAATETATKSGGKVAGPGAAVQKAAKPVAKHGTYTLLVGEFAVGQELKSVLAKLRKSGDTPVRKKQVMKLELVHRLFLAEYDSYDAASAALQRLRQLAASAFILPENGKYRVYAGSYLYEGGAAVEQERLAGKGVKLVMKSAKVAIPKTRVTAGAFPSREDAQKGANRLKKRGITATVLDTGKRA